MEGIIINPVYSDEEVSSLLASGEAVEHKDGSIRWVANNKVGKQPGSLIRRHPKAAPIITNEQAAEYAHTRLEKRKEAVETGFAVGAGRTLGRLVTPDEAVAELAARLAEAALDSDRNDYSRVARLAFEITEVISKIHGDAGRQAPRIDIGAAEIKMLIVDSDKFPFVKEMLSKDDEPTK